MGLFGRAKVMCLGSKLRNWMAYSLDVRYFLPLFVPITILGDLLLPDDVLRGRPPATSILELAPDLWVLTMRIFGHKLNRPIVHNWGQSFRSNLKALPGKVRSARLAAVLGPNSLA